MDETILLVNFLTHGRAALHDRWLLAGTQLPDWLSAVDRRSRLVKERVQEAASDDGAEGTLARGVLQHLEDDAWFHVTPAFEEVNRALTLQIRAAFPEDRRLRASFLGHVLLEVLLDARLMERTPGMIDRYYAVLETIDVAALTRVTNVLASKPAERLPLLFERFLRSQFLRGYLDDEGVVQRLDGLLVRVRQPPLPVGFVALLPAARALVYERADDLLTPPGPVLSFL